MLERKAEKKETSNTHHFGNIADSCQSILYAPCLWSYTPVAHTRGVFFQGRKLFTSNCTIIELGRFLKTENIPERKVFFA